MKRVVRSIWHLLWLGPVLLFGFLLVRADFDVRYLGRVLWHRDSSTSDYRWKASQAIAASTHPQPWRETHGCSPLALDPTLEDSGTLAFVVIKDGALACEWYGNGGAATTPAAAFSVSKIVTALVLARAVDTHAIAGYDAPITRYIPELAARDSRFEAITLGRLVDMRSGIAFEEDTTFPWVDGDAPRVYYATDLVKTVVTKPRVESPPGPFVYNDYAPNLVGVALDRAGVHPLAAVREIWQDLGAESGAMWSVDDRGFPWLESGLVVTARDLARIGQLLLAPPKDFAGYVARVREPVAASEAIAATFGDTSVGYHDAWWRLGDDFVAMGRHGQLVLVSPATHVVIVRLGLDGHGETNIAIARRLATMAGTLK